MPASLYTRSASLSRSSRASVSSGSSSGASATSSVSSRGSMGNLRARHRAGSSSFLSGRDREPSAENELFRQSRKPRSTYRRPSSLGLGKTPLSAKSESRLQYQPKPASRSHIVPKTPDNLRPEGSFVKTTEVKDSYRNLSPVRPIIRKLQDNLKPEGHLENKSETARQYENKNPARPIIYRIKDHGDAFQPQGSISNSSEYRNNYAKVQRGERVQPVWITNFEKVTIDGGDTSR